MNVFRIALPVVVSQASPVVAGGDDISAEAKRTKYGVSLHFYDQGQGEGGGTNGRNAVVVRAPLERSGWPIAAVWRTDAAGDCGCSGIRRGPGS
jgi:hypothetical protein